MADVIRFGLAGGLLILMSLARHSTGTWANPVGFYAGTFAVITLGQEVLLPDLPFSSAMAGLILGSAMALFLGMLVTWQRPAEMVDPARLPDVRRVPRTLGLYAAFAVALFYLYELSAARATGLGVTTGGVFNRADFFAAGGQTLFMRALQALTYCGVFYVALEARQRKRPVLLVGAYLLIVFAQSVVFSTKLPIIISMLLAIAVFAAGHPSRLRKIDWRTLAAVSGALFVLLFTFRLVTEIRSKGTSDAASVTGYAILGPPSAYSLVLDGKAAIDVDPRWGMSIAGVRDLVAEGHTRQFGVFTNVVWLNPNKPESSTNIYTWFVALRHDFGLVGMFVVIFGFGLLGGALTTRQVTGSLGVFGQTALALLNLELIIALITALTYYNFSLLLLAMGVPLALLYRDTSRGAGNPPLPQASRTVSARGATSPRSL